MKRPKEVYFQATIYEGDATQEGVLRYKLQDEVSSGDGIRRAVFGQYPGTTNYSLEPISRREYQKTARQFELNRMIVNYTVIMMAKEANRNLGKV